MAELRRPGDFNRIRDHGRDHIEGVWRNPVTQECKAIQMRADYYDAKSPDQRKGYSDDDLRTLLRGEPVLRSYTTSSGVTRTDEPALICHKVSQFGKDMYAAQPEHVAMNLMKTEAQKAAQQAKIEEALGRSAQVGGSGMSFENTGLG